MTRSSLVGVVMALSALFLGCAAKRLPPGTPPPEYETRTFPPWPPLAPSASATIGPPPAPAAPEAPALIDPSVPNAENKAPDGPSPDAGRE